MKLNLEAIGVESVNTNVVLDEFEQLMVEMDIATIDEKMETVKTLNTLIEVIGAHGNNDTVHALYGKKLTALGCTAEMDVSDVIARLESVVEVNEEGLFEIFVRTQKLFDKAYALVNKIDMSTFDDKVATRSKKVAIFNTSEFIKMSDVVNSVFKYIGSLSEHPDSKKAKDFFGKLGFDIEKVTTVYTDKYGISHNIVSWKVMRPDSWLPIKQTISEAGYTAATMPKVIKSFKSLNADMKSMSKHIASMYQQKRKDNKRYKWLERVRKNDQLYTAYMIFKGGSEATRVTMRELIKSVEIVAKVSTK